MPSAGADDATGGRDAPRGKEMPSIGGDGDTPRGKEDRDQTLPKKQGAVFQRTRRTVPACDVL
jgi:hypothetical protein